MNKQETHLSVADFKRQSVDPNHMGRRVYAAHKDTVGTFVVTSHNNFALLPENTTETLFIDVEGEKWKINSDIRGQLPLTLPSAVLFMKTCDVNHEKEAQL